MLLCLVGVKVGDGVWLLFVNDTVGFSALEVWYLYTRIDSVWL